MRPWRPVGLLLLPLALFAQNPTLTEIVLRADPEAQVRPLETLPLQVLAYGKVDGGADRVRMELGGAQWTAPEGGGWLSKPFRFQGAENENFYQPPDKGFASKIFREATSRFLLQDTALYTAPEKEGTYRIQASLEGKTATLDVVVSSKAPSRKPAEIRSFSAEQPSQDPYRSLVEHWSPFLAQETWFEPKADYLARFDLDGDWSGENNWENAPVGSSQAYVYYAVMETDTHWFLIYNFFHPRDYSDKCIAGSCHENDNEGLILTVRKTGAPFGRLEAMETLAHNNVYSYVDDAPIHNGEHNVDGAIDYVYGSHPAAFIESGGHGVYGGSGSHSRYSVRDDAFSAGPGVSYIYKGVAERPKHANDRMVGYELLPIWDQWWLRAQEGSGRQDRTFDAYYRYVPAGGRPLTRYQEIAGSFWGRTESENKAKPFWGWHDNRTRKKGVLATGQWGLDPAYAVSRDLRFEEPVSTQYIFNPYLGIGAPSAAPTAPVVGGAILTGVAGSQQ
ncbi:MAG: hypothetical protein GC160_11235 [Acidobacteria bacterium]|nr:hypothetical protein [Acidobacteriota bacterium]